MNEWLMNMPLARFPIRPNRRIDKKSRQTIEPEPVPIEKSGDFGTCSRLCFKPDFGPILTYSQCGGYAALNSFAFQAFAATCPLNIVD